MANIQVLDQNTINKIAAGEVIERPASVVKELLENAIDAKATAVTVEIRDGGISFIRVTDNGCGISSDEIPLAFLRHSTSKIRSVEDLFLVSSLGFRGEALSSIAAVAQVEVITRMQGKLTGTRYQIEGGAEKGTEEIGAPEGTTMIVRNLFYNTPVRKKFLKTAMTEGAHVGDLVEKIALSHPEISIRFIQNNQNKLYTSGNHSLKDIIYTVFGREITANILPIDASCGEISVRGFIGKPVIARNNRNFEHYFINGRYIKSNIIYKAIEEAYKPFMMQHKYPFTMLQLQIEPELLDVNVHPTKMELRFQNGELVFHVIRDSIKEMLMKKELIPEMSLGEKKREKADAGGGKREKRIPLPEPFERKRIEQMERADAEKAGQSERARQARQAGQAIQPEQTVQSGQAGQNSEIKLSAAGYGNPESSGTGHVKEDFVLYGPDAGSENKSKNQQENKPENQQKSWENQRKTGFVDNLDIEKNTYEPEKTENVPNVDNSGQGKNEENNKKIENNHFVDNFNPPQKDKTGKKTEHGAFVDNFNFNNINNTSTNNINNIETGNINPDFSLMQPKQMDLFEERLLSPESRSRHKLIGQLFETYWLVEFHDHLYIIDQHAAHEKVLYEETIHSLAARKAVSQMIDPPVILTLSGKEEVLFERCKKAFSDIGFEIEHFGGREYAVRAVPDNLFCVAQKELLMEMIDGLSEETVSGGSRLICERVASLSCKAAVKGNHSMSFAEADRLIDRLLKLENPYACPHGRPTIVSMSKYELEKKFKRII